MARRIPLGFSTWGEYNRYRVAEGAKLGLSKGQALGHPRKGELGKSLLGRISTPEQLGTLTDAQRRSRHEGLLGGSKFRHLREQAEAKGVPFDEKRSLQTAAREAGTTPDAIKFWNRDYSAPADTLAREIQIVSAGRVETVVTTSREEAVLAIAHGKAVQAAMEAQTDEQRHEAALRLAQYDGATVGGYELETDIDTLFDMARDGDLNDFDPHSS